MKVIKKKSLSDLIVHSDTENCDMEISMDTHARCILSITLVFRNRISWSRMVRTRQIHSESDFASSHHFPIGFP